MSVILRITTSTCVVSKVCVILAFSLQDLLSSIKTQRETGLAFLNAYLGYRKSILSLMIKTYYDFEFDQPLIARFQVRHK